MCVCAFITGFLQCLVFCVHCRIVTFAFSMFIFVTSALRLFGVWDAEGSPFCVCIVVMEVI